MNNIRKLTIIFLLAIATFSCSKIRNISVYNEFKPLEKNTRVHIFPFHEGVPRSSTFIADFEFDVSNKYDIVELIHSLEKNAIEKGGNIVCINSVKNYSENTFYGSIYRNFNRDELYNHLDSLSWKEFGFIKNKATLYIYRNDSGSSSLFNINVLMNNEQIARLKSKAFIEIPIFEEGEYSFYTSENHNEKLTINVKFGRQYYIKASQWIDYSLMVLGNLVIIEVKGGKNLAQFSSYIGKVEYNLIKMSLTN